MSAAEIGSERSAIITGQSAGLRVTRRKPTYRSDAATSRITSCLEPTSNEKSTLSHIGAILSGPRKADTNRGGEAHDSPSTGDERSPLAPQGFVEQQAELLALLAHSLLELGQLAFERAEAVGQV